MRFSPLVERISGEGAAAWEIHSAAMAAKRGGADVIVLSIGDPDFATPAPIVEAGIRALRERRHALHRHRRPAGAARRHRARPSRARRRRMSGRDNVIVLAGAQNALFAASLCLFSPGDEVIVLEPVYVTYEATIRVSGATVVPVPARRGERLPAGPRGDRARRDAAHARHHVRHPQQSVGRRADRGRACGHRRDRAPPRSLASSPTRSMPRSPSRRRTGASRRCPAWRTAP